MTTQNNGNHYTEKFWEKFKTDAGNLSFMQSVLYGTNGTSLVSAKVDANGYLIVKGPSDSYTLTNDGTNVTTFTRASDSKTLTITYVAGIPTAISDWV